MTDSDIDMEMLEDTYTTEYGEIRATRSMLWLALVWVGIITAGCIGALAYALAVNSSSTAEQGLQNVALIGVGALTTMLGVRAGNSNEAE